MMNKTPKTPASGEKSQDGAKRPGTPPRGMTVGGGKDAKPVGRSPGKGG